MLMRMSRKKHCKRMMYHCKMWRTEGKVGLTWEPVMLTYMMARMEPMLMRMRRMKHRKPMMHQRKMWSTEGIHQRNVNRSGSHTQSSLTLRATSPVLLSTSRCSQTPLELSKVLSDSARAFSGAPESTCSYGGAFRMLRDLTSGIVKFWSY